MTVTLVLDGLASVDGLPRPGHHGDVLLVALQGGGVKQVAENLGDLLRLPGQQPHLLSYILAEKTVPATV